MINMLFIQLLGFIGFILLLLSYWKDDIQDVLKMQLFSGIFYVLHYYFLGAFSALFVLMLELVRDYSYYKTDIDKYIFIGTIPFYIVISIFTYKGLLSFLPIFSSIIDGYGLSIKKETAVIGCIISEILWLIYDINCLSYIGILSGTILIISDVFVLIRDRKYKV